MRIKLLFLLVFSLFFGVLLISCQKKAETKQHIQDHKNQGKNYLVTFVELGSIRCIPCRKMVPIMKEIEEEFGDQVKVVFHDVWTDAGKPFAAKYQIRLIPTQVFLDRKGKEYFRHEGYFPKEELVKVLKTKGVK